MSTTYRLTTQAKTNKAGWAWHATILLNIYLATVKDPECGRNTAEFISEGFYFIHLSYQYLDGFILPPWSYLTRLVPSYPDGFILPRWFYLCLCRDFPCVPRRVDSLILHRSLKSQLNPENYCHNNLSYALLLKNALPLLACWITAIFCKSMDHHLTHLQTWYQLRGKYL